VSRPAWSWSDNIADISYSFLQTLFPLITVGVSLLFLVYHLIQAIRQSDYYKAYRLIDGHHAHVWDIRIPPPADLMPEAYEPEDEMERNEDLVLQRTITNHSALEVDRPRGELLIPVLEELAVLAGLGVAVAALVTNAWGHHSHIAASAGVATWAYTTFLTSVRLGASMSGKTVLPQLWYHTAFLYSSQWIFAILLFRSEIIHRRSQLSQALMSADFALLTALTLIALFSRKGNKPVQLEYEGELEPSKEPLASLISLATFSWLDPIILKGYRRTLELSDVWNLMPQDKAGAVLADYRQLKKTTVLAWHLLKYFKTGFLVQASWAAISGVNTFIPTLLLKVILEYVEDPQGKPKNAAWLYVILLFVSGSIQALSAGQALWTGRKICIRLRAIIIGEIYQKALRRRAAAAGDKVLGQGDKTPSDQSKLSLTKRFATLFKKKSADDKKKEAAKAAKAKDASEEGQVTSGAIINLMAVDSFKVSEVSAYLHFLWAETPVQLVFSITLLYQLLGYSSIAGIGTMIVLAPINFIISKQFSRIQKQILAATDARIHTTNEVLSNIRIIKYFAWEQRFLAQVDEKRQTELKYLRNRYIVWSIASVLWSGAPIIITFLTFLVYTIVEKRELIPSVAFTALSLFSLLRVPLDQLADMVAHVQESKVSVDRVEEYLNEPETDKYKQLKSAVNDSEGQPLIGFDHATFSWGAESSEEFKMMELDMRFKVGQLNVIVGPTGSGKTSLLMALLGEMTLIEGNVYLPGGRSREDMKVDPDTGLTESVAYCAQQAWLVNGTIKDNIIFASEWDPSRYKDVIVACSLQRDLEILDGGDQTLVGEKGVTLSGGQKQRISLARALYCRARHVLLDDVLSAVDAHTAKWIFDKAVMGPLMYHRTCILVTHNAALCLPHAEVAVALDNGRVVAQGTADEVIDSGKLGEDLTKSRAASRAPSRIPSKVPDGNKSLAEAHANGSANGSTEATNGAPKDGAELAKVISHKQLPGMQPDADPNATGEKKAEGSVSFKVILLYLQQMGGIPYWSLAGGFFVLQQIAQVATNVWIRQWANAYGSKRDYSITSADHSSHLTHIRGGISGSYSCIKSSSCVWAFPMSSISQNAFTAQAAGDYQEPVNDAYFLGVYAVLGLTFMIVTLVRVGWLFRGSLQASKRIHRRLISAVTHAKFRFFDSTPLGQLMNRFSKDIELVDQEIAPVAEGAIHCMAAILTIIILISVITPKFLIAGVFITIIYFMIGSLYINSSRDLKRLESVQRSPLYQQFGETLSGMTTIRAYGDERRFIRENLTKVNTHSRPFIYLWGANRWLAFRVDMTGALVSFFTGMFVILSVGTVDAGAAGLAMTYAVTFTENVLWFVRLYSMNEQNMNAVERVKEYFDVDQEAALIVENNRPPANWPSKGAVEFIGYSTRYRPDFDFVLKNITFRIPAGEKVGVVGRTGAGKSSLALAMFRALEAEEGKIVVDEMDIGLLGLQDLRENIVMVPQDPTLFTGTIRTNLDPFGLFTDEEIFTALRRVQLIGPASAEPSRPSTPTKNAAKDTDSPTATEASTSGTTAVLENKNVFRNLSSTVAESGSNLSQGQRQLLCLARAILKAPMVLLMDEATASIDYATDAKIQETIREFKNTTITIAHRLQTIIDYDKVLVLDKGEVVEYGDPWDLVRKDAGIFRGMCEMSGDLDVLEKEAKKAHESRRLVDDEA